MTYNMKNDALYKALNKHKELFAGQKVKYRKVVYWANMVTMEVFAHSEEAEINGVINGYKVANITPDYECVLIL